jgi:hypothetical protein
MSRDKFKDDDLFSCQQDWELRYIADLYADKQEVYNFLKGKCKNGTIHNFTYILVYELIKKELKLPIPN